MSCDGGWVMAMAAASLSRFGRLAQLVRALPSHGRGRGFESLIAHSEKPLLSRGFLASGAAVGSRSGRKMARKWRESPSELCRAVLAGAQLVGLRRCLGLCEAFG